MTTDMAAPATKKDLAILKKTLQKSCASKKDLNKLSCTTEELKHGLARTDERLTDFHDEFLDFKDESIRRFNRLDEHMYGLGTRMDDMKEELKLHFDTAVEIIRHDLRSANKEEILNIKDRVTRLEVRTGIRAA